MEEKGQSDLDPKWITYQILLRSLPEKQLSAWMQVGKNDLDALKAWIKLSDQDENNDKTED